MRRASDGQIPRPSPHPAPRDRLPVRPAPVRPRLRPATSSVRWRIPTVNSHRRYRGGQCLRPIALTLLAATCVVILPARSAAAASQGPAPLAETAGGRIAWADCGVDLECAKVRVPLD